MNKPNHTDLDHELACELATCEYGLLPYKGLASSQARTLRLLIYSGFKPGDTFTSAQAQHSTGLPRKTLEDALNAEVEGIKIFGGKWRVQDSNINTNTVKPSQTRPTTAINSSADKADAEKDQVKIPTDGFAVVEIPDGDSAIAGGGFSLKDKGSGNGERSRAHTVPPGGKVQLDKDTQRSSRRGRPAGAVNRKYVIPDLHELKKLLHAKPVTAPIDIIPEECMRTSQYRVALRREEIKLDEGQRSYRAQQAKRYGVSPSTMRRYDKLAGIKWVTNVSMIEVASHIDELQLEEEAIEVNEAPRRKICHWLEIYMNNNWVPHPPSKLVAEAALMDGRQVIYMRRTSNSYFTDEVLYREYAAEQQRKEQMMFTQRDSYDVEWYMDEDLMPKV